MAELGTEVYVETGAGCGLGRDGLRGASVESLGCGRNPRLDETALGCAAKEPVRATHAREVSLMLRRSRVPALRFTLLLLLLFVALVAAGCGSNY
jgi:hypothetical protein